jgi:hypothetical protein
MQVTFPLYLIMGTLFHEAALRKMGMPFVLFCPNVNFFRVKNPAKAALAGFLTRKNGMTPTTLGFGGDRQSPVAVHWP